jgi:glutathione synthase
MRLIVAPEGMGNYLLRADNGDGGRSVKAEVVSELGIFGWALFGAGKVVDEKTLGWLLRTKSKESDEGGVAVGVSVIDSVVLVDS